MRSGASSSAATSRSISSWGSWRPNRFLAIVGASGCGKSSLVRAGMISALEGGYMPRAGPRWRIAEIRPGDRPFLRCAAALLAGRPLRGEVVSADDPEAFLASTLRRGPYGLVEALRESPLPDGTTCFCWSTSSRRSSATTDMATAARPWRSSTFCWRPLPARSCPAYVVLTMRSDFLGDCRYLKACPRRSTRAIPDSSPDPRSVSRRDCGASRGLRWRGGGRAGHGHPQRHGNRPGPASSDAARAAANVDLLSGGV